MKQKITLTIAIIFIGYFVQAQTCTITCNLTTTYVCPGSNTWKSNPTIYNDTELMKELGYTKDSKGCWNLAKAKTTTIKQKDKKKAQSWWDKMKNAFSGLKKTGF